jgi:hypothetical protein
VNRRDPQLLRERAAAAVALCERWGFQMLAVSATAPLGWAQAIEGDPAGGARQLRQALARWAATGSQAARPQLLGLLAEAEQLQADQTRRCASWMKPWPRSTGPVSVSSKPSCTGSRVRACWPCRRYKPTRPRPPLPPRSRWPGGRAPSCWRIARPPAWTASGPPGGLKAPGRASRPPSQRTARQHRWWPRNRPGSAGPPLACGHRPA